MIPLTVTREELHLARWLGAGPRSTAALKGMKQASRDVTIGTMIETPRAAIRADEIAEEADFFSFGTNDLTQMTFGFSRDDVESRMMPAYLEQGLLKRNPFETIDQDGVGELVRIGAQLGRETKPKLKLGVCGEHGGDPESIALFYDAGLDYVSCTPFRVPIARLAAAQAIVGAGSVLERRKSAATARRRRSRPRLSEVPVTVLSPPATASSFVDLDVQPWHWAVLLGVIVVLLLVDLLVLHREAARGHAARGGDRVGRVGRRSASASRSSCGRGSAATATSEYLSGYLIEQSLSVDNVFVWALILTLLRGARRSTSTGCCSGASSARSCCGRRSSSPASR